MNNKDAKLKLEINWILKNKSPGLNLINYFENIEDKKLRRAIHVLSSIYPDRMIISNDDLSFITYAMTSKKFLKQESFSNLIFSLSIIDFNAVQNKKMVYLVKTHFIELCESCQSSLDVLLENIFEPYELFKYLELQVIDGNKAVLYWASFILNYSDFSNSSISDEALETLKNRVKDYWLRLEK